MRSFVFFLLAFMAIAAYSRQITCAEAEAIANDFFSSNAAFTHRTKHAVSNVAMTTHKYDTEPYFIFNASDNNGYVIISGDTRTNKILGYSDSGSIDISNMPPQLAWLLGEYEKLLSTIDTSAPNHVSWQNSAPVQSTPEGIILRTANWGQGYPYNVQCPIIEGSHTFTGCVPTAMAIIMHYHKWPTEGKHEHHYTLSPGGAEDEFSWDFSDYRPNWNLIRDEYDTSSTDEASVKAISDLMMAAGIASRVNYILDSGTTLIDAMVGLRRFLTFGASLKLFQQSNLTSSEWKALIRREIDDKRPVLYSCAQSSDYTGHAFVIDGYSTANDMFHINWGWDGNANGFYAIESLTPSGYNFDIQHQMVTGIGKPEADDDSYSDFSLSPDILIDPIYGTGQTESINISVENVISGEPFNCVTPAILWPPHAEATIGLALVDEKDNIKEVVKSNQFRNILDDLFSQPSFFANVKFECGIDPTDRLQIVARESNDTEWRRVTAQHHREPSISVHGNTPKTKPIIWNIDPRLYIDFFGPSGPTSWMPFYSKEPFEEIAPKMNSVLNNLELEAHVDFGKCTGEILCAVARVNGVMRAAQIHDESVSTGTYMQFVLESGGSDYQQSQYEVEVTGLSAEDGRTYAEIDVTDENAVAEYCASHNCTYITDLKLSGNGNGDVDLRPIYNNMPFLMSLDLSLYKPQNRTLRPYVFSSVADGDYEATDAELESSRGEPWVIKTGLQCLKELMLPTELDSIKAGAFYLCNIDHLTIPRSVEYIGPWAFCTNINVGTDLKLKYVVCESPIPAKLAELGFGELEQNHTILYVPEGSRDSYINAPEWSKFVQIIEYEGEFNSVNEVAAEDINGDIVIYNLSGILLFSGNEEDCPTLQPGIYITKRRGLISKFAVYQ